MKRRQNRLAAVVIVSALSILFLANLPGSATGEAYSGQQAMVERAKLTFQKFVSDPNIGWGPNQAKNVMGIMIVPQLLRGAFIFGGAGGSGVFLARDEKTGSWSDPAFYTIGSASFGLQIGADASEMVLLVLTRKGMETYLTTSFKLGGDLSVAAGPVGVGGKGATSFQTADILAYSLAKGAFAGVSVEGAVVKTSNKSNEAYYGTGTRATDILIARSATNKGATELVAAVSEAMK